MKHPFLPKLILLLCLIFVLTLGTTTVLAQGGGSTPTVSYQGRVTVNGQPFDGTGYFMFAIVNSQGQLTWTSDVIVQAQSRQQLSPPTQPISIPVSQGLFNVLLGDPLSMNPLLPQAFLDPQSFLRVWFSSDGLNFTQLPDRPLAAVPYAIVADTLDGYTANDFAPAAHNHWGETWSGNGTGLQLQSNNKTGLDVRTNSTTGFDSAIYAEASSSAGATKGVAGLTNGGGNGAAGVWGQADSASGVTFGVYGQNQSATDGAAGVSGFSQATSGKVSGVEGVAQSPDGYGVRGFNQDGVGVYGESTTVVGVSGRQGQTSGLGPIAGAGIWGDSANHPGVWGSSVDAAGVVGITSHEVGVGGLANQDDGIGVQGTAPVTGTVGIATNTSGQTYGVYGRSYSDDGYGVYGQGTKNGSGVRGESIAGKGVVGFSTTGVGVYGSGWFFGNAGKFENMTTITPTVIINNVNSSAGGPGLVVTGTTTIRASVEGEQGVLAVFNDHASGTGVYAKATFGVYGESETTDGVGVYGVGRSSGAVGIFGFNRNGGQAGEFVAEIADAAIPDAHAVEIRNLGSGGAGPDGLAIVTPFAGDTPGSSVNFVTFFSGGNNTAVGAIEGNGYGGVIYKSGGADFAELLPAAPGLEPGDVVVIGPDGKLIRSRKANQTNVAGVYSTAPGFLGGMTSDMESMEARKDVANPRAPIAIVGIVPVKVSAENGAIRPGDLLTPATTPGHAMKASPVNVGGIEFYRPGTIIGKALEPLTEGTGVISVLITLH